MPPTAAAAAKLRTEGHAGLAADRRRRGPLLGGPLLVLLDEPGQRLPETVGHVGLARGELAARQPPAPDEADEAARKLGIRGQHPLEGDGGTFLQLAVDIGHQGLVARMHVDVAHPLALSPVPPSQASSSRLRARASRLITVPIGTPRTSATSR